MHCAAARRGGHTEVPTDMTSELCRLNQSFPRRDQYATLRSGSIINCKGISAPHQAPQFVLG